MYKRFSLVSCISYRSVTCTELLLVGAAEVLLLVVHVEVPGELLVVLRPGARLPALPPVPRVALHPAVDDVDRGPEAWPDPVQLILDTAGVSTSAADDPSVSQSVFTNTEKAFSRAFSWLKVPTSAFTFKTLLIFISNGRL